MHHEMKKTFNIIIEWPAFTLISYNNIYETNFIFSKT